MRIFLHSWRHTVRLLGSVNKDGTREAVTIRIRRVPISPPLSQVQIALTEH